MRRKADARSRAQTSRWQPVARSGVSRHQSQYVEKEASTARPDLIHLSH
ncbi:IMP cyclohydrolase / Phosphoribosylaminoimidazolecarboxamide formyltransferase [Caballeronia sordidicola]|uniref:IMP cyclohydrolase / Phosphoribosylaminoimidazolecarboxamide formyltransferase n=1 Tax=Caballeronia sordidicola TaxID=196367 RepID=A0A242M656_CABSO|nr:IMP cyclohydrolase / Phosphoribosylaminoimidazolecarboxamide formyltransferase [Caballeronia sordidicola]